MHHKQSAYEPAMPATLQQYSTSSAATPFQLNLLAGATRPGRQCMCSLQSTPEGTHAAQERRNKDTRLPWAPVPDENMQARYLQHRRATSGNQPKHSSQSANKRMHQIMPQRPTTLPHKSLYLRLKHKKNMPPPTYATAHLASPLQPWLPSHLQACIC
jgi:hypothetical protein